MNLDQQLRGTFKRGDAPPEFAERVLVRLDQSIDAHTVSSTAKPPALQSSAARWLAAAAAVVLAAIGTAQYMHEQAAAKEAARVENDVRIALRITSEKLALVQHRLQESHR